MANLNLIIDIGNSSCKAALFDGGAMVETHKGSNSRIEILDKWCADYVIDRAIVSSVIELSDEISRQLESLPCPYVRFSTSMPLPVKLLYRTPETLGVDRLAAVIGAQAEAPGKDILVIDAGSAITYDFLDADGNYHGGNIAPGLAMRLKALHEQTGKLPLVGVEGDTPALGYNTETAIRSGVVRGIRYEIDGYVSELREKYPTVLIFLTGGDEKSLIYSVKNNVKSCIFADEFLVLKGLNRILTNNDTI